MLKNNPRVEEKKKKWENYRENLTSHFKQAYDHIIRHNIVVDNNGDPSKDTKELQAAEEAAAKMKKIIDDLKIYAKLFKAIENDETILPYLKEIAASQLGVTSFLIQLKKIIADKFLHKFDREVNKDNKRAAIIKAHQCTEEAWQLKTENIDLLGENYDKDLSDFREYTNERFIGYVNPSMIKEGDQIQIVLVQARNIKDKERAFDAFQKAVNLAKESNDNLMEFKILWEQARDYIDLIRGFTDHHINLDVIMHRHRIIQKIGKCFLDALEVRKQIKNHSTHLTVIAYSEGICIDLYFLSKICMQLASYPCLNNHLNIQEELLTDGYRYCVRGQEVIVSKKVEEYKLLKLQLECGLKCIEEEKDKINDQKNKKIEEELLREELQEEYNKKFKEILDGFSQKKKESNNNNKPSVGNVEDNDNALPDIPEEEEISLITVNFEQSEVRNLHPNTINLDDQLALLKKVQGSNNLLEQINVRTTIAECYRIKALRCLQHQRLELAIEYLEHAKNYLLIAMSDIDHANQKRILPHNNSSLTQLEEGITIVLENTRQLLCKTIKKQADLAEDLKNTHRNVKAYMISKYGRSAWYKFKAFDWEKLSPEAKERLKANSNLKRLRNIAREVSKLIGEHIAIQQDERALIDRSSAEQVPLPQLTQVDFIDARELTRAFMRYNIFYGKETKQVKIKRSLSCDSFFDLADEAIRKDERRGFGRA